MIDFTGDNSATFTITFVQVAAGTQAEVRDKSVARIFTALNLSHRSRWEIIDRRRQIPEEAPGVPRAEPGSG